MAKLPTTRLDLEALDNLPEEQLPAENVEQAPLPTAKPGQMWRNAAARRGQSDEYDNMMADKYGEGW